MSYEVMCPIFPNTKEDRQDIRKQLGLKESTIEEDVDAIMEWFQKQPHLVEAGIERDFVERMLIISKGSIEKTKRRIDNWYKGRLLAPEIIQGREKVLSDSQDLWGSYLQVSMPCLLNSQRVSVVQFTDPDPNKFSFETLMRNSFMLADIRMKNDYILNDIWLLDLKNTSFAHLLKVNPIIMQKSANLFHEGLGVRIQAIHILNAPNFLQQLLTFMRQFVSSKIMDRVVIHDTLEDLHKSIPKRNLPKDYGGEQKAMSEFRDIYEKELRSTKTKQLIINAMKIVSNEKLRPNSEISEDYLAGSFRKLDFD